MQFHFSTVVWGPWHTQVFLDVNLPSLLAPNNLAAFAARHDVTYRIMTSKRDIPRIQASPAFRAANNIVPFELIPCDVENSENPIAMHHQLWRRSIDEAKEAGAMILFVPPDVIWSNAAFGHVAEWFSQGKKAVFITYMRVVAETCVPEVQRTLTAQDGVTIDAPSRALVELALQYMHPLTLTYLRDSPNFPIHPEFILWRVPGEGYLMRVLVREMFAYDPNLFELNEQALLGDAPDPEAVHYITDSDDLFALSLAPLAKDIVWYSRPQRLDPLKISSWWLTYDSPANDLVAARYFHIRRGERTRSKWHRAELESDQLMNRLKGGRDLLRILRSMPPDTARRVRQLLGLALARTRLAQFVHRRVPYTALLPRDSEILRWLYQGGAELLKLGRANKLIELILDHLVLGHVALVPGQDMTLTTAVHGKRELTWIGKTPYVDGVVAQTTRISLTQDISIDASAFMIGGVLPPSRRPPVAQSAARSDSLAST